MAGLVDVLHDQRGKVAGKVGAQAVHLHHHDAPAAQRTGRHRHLLAALTRHFDRRRVRVLGRPLGKLKVYVHAVALGPCVAVRDAFVVRLIAQQTGNQRAIRAVSASRRRKRTKQRNLRALGRPLAQKAARRQPDPNGAGGMRAARPDHNRPQNVKQIHACSPFFCFLPHFKHIAAKARAKMAYTGEYRIV